MDICKTSMGSFTYYVGGGGLEMLTVADKKAVWALLMLTLAKITEF